MRQQVEVSGDKLAPQSGAQESGAGHLHRGAISGEGVFKSWEGMTFRCTLMGLRYLTNCLQVTSNNKEKVHCLCMFIVSQES